MPSTERSSGLAGKVVEFEVQGNQKERFRPMRLIKNQINHMLDLLSTGHAVTVSSDYLPKIVERPSH